MSSCSSVKPVAVPEQATLSVMTYNVNYAMSNRNETLQILQESEADIICLQETHEYWERYLTPYLKEKYPYIEFKEGSGAGGLAMISKYPFETKTEVKAERGWFSQWLVQVETPLGACQIFNLHLKPGINERGRIGCMGSAWFRGLNIHKEELRLCLQEIDPAIPALILGDLNENDGNKGCKKLRKKGYQDALDFSSKKEKTWNWSMGKITLKGRYDHIFYSESVRCYSVRVNPVGPSDHFPVTGVLSF